MKKKYIGRLQSKDPLHSYLQKYIQPQMNGVSYRAEYSVFKLNASNDVYLYVDKYSGLKLVGKFFSTCRNRDVEKASHGLRREFNNLHVAREHGLASSPHYVVRPLGANYRLNNLLVVEFCEGESLSNVIQKAIYFNDHARLFRKLTALGYFLSSFHNRTAIEEKINVHEECAYFEKLIKRLHKINAVNWDEARELYWLRDCCYNNPAMWEDRQVLVHGDATPENFIFGHGLNVISFDLERSRHGDRMFDVGRITGELKHFFLRYTGNKYAAEPFIGHFLWEYCCHFPDRYRAFDSIAGRLPFHQAATLLRISRNDWVSPQYRRQLIDEAKNCLRSIT